MAATASAQRAHIDTVMQVAGHGIGAPQAQAHDEIIRASWQRCVHQHRLDPTRMQEAVILPGARLREQTFDQTTPPHVVAIKNPWWVVAECAPRPIGGGHCVFHPCSLPRALTVMSGEAR